MSGFSSRDAGWLPSIEWLQSVLPAAEYFLDWSPLLPVAIVVFIRLNWTWTGLMEPEPCKAWASIRSSGAIADDGKCYLLKKWLVDASARDMSRPLSSITLQDRNERHHLYLRPFDHIPNKRGRDVKIKSSQSSSPAHLLELKTSSISSSKATIALLWVWTSLSVRRGSTGLGFWTRWGSPVREL